MPRINNNLSLSSGLTVEVDAAVHSNFDVKNAAQFFRYVMRILYSFFLLIAKLLFFHHLLPKVCCVDLCPQKQARWGCDDVSIHPG